MHYGHGNGDNHQKGSDNFQTDILSECAAKSSQQRSADSGNAAAARIARPIRVNWKNR